MNFVQEKIMNYAEIFSDDEPDLLQHLRRETWQKVTNPRMLSGVYQGRLLAMLSKIISPKKILEIGTFTGYATLCLSEGLRSEGVLYTIDCNEELQDLQQKYFSQAEKSQQIIPILGNALEIIAKLPDDFDLVFLDADKSNYVKYLEMIVPKVKTGGIILADNVLWSGKVTTLIKEDDLDTLIIDSFNKKVKNDSRLENIILPLRDGINLIRKI